MRFHIVASIFLGITSTAMCANYHFDCRKIPGLCKNGATCNNTGACQCTDDSFIGYNCLATNVTGTCPTPCENEGTCFLDAPDSSLCACPFGYYGTFCESEFATIICGKESATFTLSYPPEFIGRFTFVDRNGTVLNTSNCPVIETVDNRTTISAALDISNTSSAEASTCYVKDEQGTFTTYTAYFVVNYDKDIVSSLDDILELTCNHSTDGNFSVSSEITSVTFDSENFNKVDGSEGYSPILLAVTDDANQPLGSEVAIGDPIQLFLFLDSNSGYDSLRFKACTANNTLEDPDNVTFKFLEESCPTQRGKIISTKQEIMTKSVEIDSTPTDVTGIIVTFEAFKFSNSEQIGVVCTAMVCETGDTSCSLPTDCDTGNSSNPGLTTKRRKKRAAPDGEQSVSRTFKVRGKNVDRNDQNTDEEQDQEQGSVDSLEKCMATSEITAVVAVLGAAVCVLLIVCFLLACHILRNGGKRVTTYDATTLQPTTDRFQIPRAHVNESYGEI